MDYEYKYNHLLKNVDSYRNDMLDQKDMLESLIESATSDSAKRALRREWAMANYAVGLLDIWVRQHSEKLTDADRIILNDKVQEVK